MAMSGAVLVVAVMVAFTATSGYGFTTIPGDLKPLLTTFGELTRMMTFSNASVPAMVTGVKLVAN